MYEMEVVSDSRNQISQVVHVIIVYRKNVFSIDYDVMKV